MTPPRRWERLLAWTLRDSPHRDAILGDLEEEFRVWRSAGRPKALIAGIRYRVHALGLAAQLHNDSSHRFDIPGTERLMHRWLRDTRYAFGSLNRSPGLVAMVVLTLGLGIGANVAIFSVVNGVLLTPLGFDEPDRVVAVWATSNEATRRPLPAADFDDLRMQADLLEVAGRWSNTGSLTGDHDPREVGVGWVDIEYFPMLRIAPLHGRLMNPDELRAIVLGHAIWRQLYGADPAIVGSTIDLDGDAFTVVGVLPPSPDPNLPSTNGRIETSEIWRLMPLDWYQGSDDRTLGWLRATARLREGVTLEQAQQQFDRIAGEARPPVADTGRPEYWFNAEPVLDNLVGDVAPTLTALAGAVGFVLLIAALNVAQLLLTRGRARAAELAVRSALGAGRRDLLRQLVMESVLLATAGGIAGALIGAASVRALLNRAPANLPRLDEIAISNEVLIFAACITGLVALVSGVIPALSSTRNPGSVLRAQSGTPGRRFRRLSSMLVIGEVALSLVLLTGAGLLGRSFLGLAAEAPGFQPQSLLTLSVTASGGTGGDQPNPFTPILRHLSEAPGVLAVGGTNRLPLGGGLFTGNYATESMGAESEDKPWVDFRWITPGYLEAMGTSVIEGRALTDDDGEDKILVDAQIAEAAWPGETAIGKLLWTGNLGRNGEWSEVVGVVDSMKHTSVAAPAEPTVFFHAVNAPANRLYFAIRTIGDPATMTSSILAELERADPGATISRVRTMDSLVSDANAPWRFALSLMAAFASVAVTITVVGLYGVVAYGVTQRTREFGIRIALGASGQNVARLVLSQTMGLVTVGTIVGVMGAAALSGLLGSLLFNVAPTDPMTYAGVAAFMLIAALIGAWRPTRRAVRVDPRVTMTGP
ncbi:MAG: FtsX-like permease family protein [Acidobacteria bacterium]|nr:FtsX-like permease family protein [Acidobacteriota bacterium]